MADDPLTLNLRILSPSSEVDAGLTFPALAAATTVAQLRERIQDAVPSRPALDRMRLIYRGRVVANDADTLETVFGAANLRDSHDQSLHLVLRELPPPASATPTPSTPTPRTASLPPNPFRPAQDGPPPASPSLQTNPFRTLPQPHPQPHPHPHHHHHHHAAPGPVNPFAIPALPPMQQHIAQAMAQAGHPMLAQAQPPVGGLPIPANAAPSTFPTNARTVRQEGIGPNGERWSVTIGSTNNLPMLPQHPFLPRPFAQPPGLGLPPPLAGLPVPDRAGNHPLVSRLRGQVQEAHQELDNARTLLQSPGGLEAHAASSPSSGPPVWRNDRALLHLQNSERLLNAIEQSLILSVFDPVMAHHPDVPALRQSVNELRARVDIYSRMISRQQGGLAPGEAAPLASHPPSNNPLDASATPGPPSTTSSAQPLAQTAAPAMPSEAAPELFILSSPQGPVGVLFNQQGTFTTAPILPTMSYQSFTDQFNRNRQLIAGLGQQIASNSSQAHHHLANIQPTPTQQPAAGGDGAQQPLNQPQLQQNQNANQNLDQNQNANQVADENANAPAQNLAAHLWLLFKLACFVYIFAGGGGWYRPIMLGIIAAGVYFAQLGIFQEQVNAARRYFAAVLPVNALAERVVQRRPNAQAQRTDPIRNLTPHEAAQRLLQQQRDQRFNWVRESLRVVERALALFLASLWPGFGERIVRAEEDRARAEREAEEARIRLEEEARARDAEAKKSRMVERTEEKMVERSEDKTVERTENNTVERTENNTVERTEDGTGEDSNSSAKGKEKAIIVEEDVAQVLD